MTLTNKALYAQPTTTNINTQLITFTTAVRGLLFCRNKNNKQVFEQLRHQSIVYPSRLTNGVSEANKVKRKPKGIKRDDVGCPNNLENLQVKKTLLNFF